MNVIAIIPARGGSKGIPRKNLKDLCGKPLIGHVLEAAGNVPEIDRLIVSTEDIEIAEVAKQYGAEVPFMRPMELAEDATGTLPVLQHTVKYLETNENYVPDVVVLLYATSPMISSERISEGIRLMLENDFDSVISVVEDRGHYWIEDENGYRRFYPLEIKNRQLTKPLFKENGAMYISRRGVLIEENLLVGDKVGFLIMQERESVDIDEQFDFELVEILMANKNSNLKL